MYKYDDSACGYEHIGKLGFVEASMDIYKEKLPTIFGDLDKTTNTTPYFKVLHKLNADQLIGECQAMVDRISSSQYKDVVYIGMGGAILNPMMVSALKNDQKCTKGLHFINSTDQAKFYHVLKAINIRNTAFVIISNSGETTETISVMGAFINEFQRAGITDISQNFFYIIGDDNNTLRKIAAKNKCMAITYDKDVGGRFSCFSASAIAPAMIAGLDARQYIDGANRVINELWTKRQDSQAVHAAMTVLSLKQPMIVNLSYNFNMYPFLEWYCQIISESLGKENIGYTPLRGIAPMEQHSMLQLYLGGPKDKLYTLIYSGNKNSSDKPSVAANMLDGNSLNAKTLEEVNRVMYESTRNCIKQKGLPVRTIELDALDEQSLGALIMHCSIEVIFLGLLLGLDPFDQPEVDMIKSEAKRLLSR